MKGLLFFISFSISLTATSQPGQTGFISKKWPTSNVDSQRQYYNSGELEIMNQRKSDTLWRTEFFMDGTPALKAEIIQYWRHDTVYTISPITYLDTMLFDSGYYDQRVGQYDEWHPNGALKFSGQYTHGRAQGKWTEWDSSGSLYKDYTFEDGWPTGEFKEFYPSGQVMKKGTYVVITKPDSGRSISYEGELSYYHFIRTISLLDRNYEEHHPNGELAKRGKYDLGKKVGTWKEWDENGRLVTKKRFPKKRPSD